MSPFWNASGGRRPPTMALALVGAMLAAGVPSGAVAQTPHTLNASAGGESPDATVQVNAFAPGVLTIGVGDSITWHLDSTEFHTVHFMGGAPPPDFVDAGPDGVFLNSLAAGPVGGSSYDGSGVAGSGLLTKGQTYTLAFPKSGTFEYVCLVHPNMKGTVNVKPTGDPTDTQAQVDARRTEEINSALAEHGIPVLMSNVGELAVEGASAGLTAGAGDQKVMIARFLPERVTVKVGDQVTWIWKDPATPHTVTFLSGDPPPDVAIPRMSADGTPRLELNPGILKPAGDPTSFAGGPLNSGFLDAAQLPPGSPAPTFTVRFDQPGTFDYRCLLHEGMQGTIVVES